MSEADVKEWSGKRKPGMPLFEGPQEMRDAFIRAKGIDWTASYIDPATWLPASRSIVCRTMIAHRRIIEQASIVCDRQRITVRPPPAQHARIAAE